MANLIRLMSNFMKGKGGLFIFVAIVVGLGILFIVPFILVFALRLIGAPVEYSFSSWVGSLILLSIFGSSGPSGNSE